MQGLESDLLNLVKAVPAFYNPILALFTAPHNVITDAGVLARIGYNRLPQNTQKPVGVADAAPQPFLSWKGPFNFDHGQVAVGSSHTKKATFWFMLYHQSATDCMSWADDIRLALETQSFPTALSVYRLTAAIFKDMSPVAMDQTQITGKEYPIQCATIGYEFGFQVK